MKRYRFRKMRKEEIPQMFSLVLQRMAWMDAMGIQQWNVTNYTDVYPMEYYAEQCEKGRMYALTDGDGTLVCAAALLEQDDRWDDNSPSIYLHHFVSKVGEKGVGAIFLQYAQEYGLRQKKTYFRLDSAADNGALAQYYKAQGFLPVGECRDGPYRGILRQKKL